MNLLSKMHLLDYWVPLIHAISLIGHNTGNSSLIRIYNFFANPKSYFTDLLDQEESK